MPIIGAGVRQHRKTHQIRAVVMSGYPSTLRNHVNRSGGRHYGIPPGRRRKVSRPDSIAVVRTNQVKIVVTSVLEQRVADQLGIGVLEDQELSHVVTHFHDACVIDLRTDTAMATTP